MAEKLGEIYNEDGKLIELFKDVIYELDYLSSDDDFNTSSIVFNTKEDLQALKDSNSFLGIKVKQ